MIYPYFYLSLNVILMSNPDIVPFFDVKERGGVIFHSMSFSINFCPEHIALFTSLDPPLMVDWVYLLCIDFLIVSFQRMYRLHVCYNIPCMPTTRVSMK